MPVISGIIIAELAVEEWFSDGLFSRKKFFGAVWVEYFPVSNGWDVRPRSEERRVGKEC